MNILRLLDKLSDDKFFTSEASRLETVTNISLFGKSSYSSCASWIRSDDGYSSQSRSSKTGLTGILKSTLTDALQLALVLEYLENEYYSIGLSTP